MAYSHQDWSQVVLKKKDLSQPQKVAASKDIQATATTSSVSNKPAWKIEKEVDSDVGKPVKYVSIDDATKIINGRISKKLSQQALATALNMKLRDIQEIETRKAVENKAVIAKIKRFLQIA